jgi:hypothetical protein
VGSDPAVTFLQEGADTLKGSNTLSVSAGTYTVTEANTPISGYVTTYDKCSNIVVAAGGTQTCTITNDDKTAPGISTVQNVIPNDSATISGATSSASGTITFALYAPTDASCADPPALTEDVPVSGSGPYSTTNTTFVASVAGTWKWKVIYSGDANNLSSTSDCGVEQFTIKNS